MTSTTSGAAPATSGIEDRRDDEAGRAERPRQRRSIAPRAEAVAVELLHDHDRHQHERDRQDRGDPGARDAARRQALASARDGEVVRRNDQEQTKKASSTSRRPRSTAWRRGSESRRTSAVTRGCCPCRSAAMPPTHISHAEQQAGDLLGPGNRLVQDVAADDLQADDRGLRDHEDRDRPLERAVRGRLRRAGDSGGALTRGSPRATT